MSEREIRRLQEHSGLTANNAKIESLAQKLLSDKFRDRGEAVGELAKIGGSRAIELLCLALNDPRKQVRASAVQALGKLRSRESLPTLSAALKDRTPTVRKQAVEAVGRIASADVALELLVPALRDPDNRVVYRAVQVCASFHDARFVEPLLAIGTTRNPQLRQLVIRALAPLRDLRTVLFFARTVKSGPHLASRLASYHLKVWCQRVVIPRELVKAIDLNPSYRIEALEAIWVVLHSGVPKFLLPTVKDYCNCILRDDQDPDAKRGALNLLDYANLVRGSQPEGGPEGLLRAASATPIGAGADELLRCSQSEQTESPRDPPSIWKRLFGRKRTVR